MATSRPLASQSQATLAGALHMAQLGSILMTALRDLASLLYILATVGVRNGYNVT